MQRQHLAHWHWNTALDNTRQNIGQNVDAAAFTAEEWVEEYFFRSLNPIINPTLSSQPLHYVPKCQIYT